VTIKQLKEDTLTTHKKSKHEGKKNPCDSCDYQATERGHLTTHKQSKHEGNTYIHVTHVTIGQLLANP
jgi:hypothetical protein